VYDGLGRREKKAINSSLTEFLFHGLNLVQETSGANILTNILPGLGIDEFLTRTDVGASATSAFLPDALGSSIALTSSGGAVQTEYTYEAFGKTTITGASNTSPYQYTGRENDGSGLYYYRARYYHPQVQRFISEDPIEFAGRDINLFSCVSNRPSSFRDPHGLIPGLDEPLPRGFPPGNALLPSKPKCPPKRAEPDPWVFIAGAFRELAFRSGPGAFQEFQEVVWLLLRALVMPLIFLVRTNDWYVIAG
jgi:RHS repeat-associated protein